ncbi:hypothetical protein RRG08_015699 [Elysia crispata]|uniref:Uncharacterized protein n=1 Tax=Elysia crispata TaxID=231223 RepID=A0AAE1BDJ4_9GAST|nr:hypothetical protein RRG08_015699 [Elysia crispata]
MVASIFVDEGLLLATKDHPLHRVYDYEAPIPQSLFWKSNQGLGTLKRIELLSEWNRSTLRNPRESPRSEGISPMFAVKYFVGRNILLSYFCDPDIRV